MMPAMLAVGVMGAGAIGCYVGGRLAACGSDVRFVGRPRLQQEIAEAGLELVDIGRRGRVLSVRDVRYSTDPASLAGCDVVLVCVKSGQTREVGQALAGSLREGTLVVSLQNGIDNADRLRAVMPKQSVLGGIVAFNVVHKGAGVFRRATTGPLVIETPPGVADERIKELGRLLELADFEVELASDIRPLQWSKLVMNLNNAVSALTDVPTPRLVFEKPYSRILAALMREALAVIAGAGIRPARLGPLPVTWFPTLLGMPTPLLRALARLQVEIDPEARSSMWEDLSRGRPTEVAELNGAIVELATQHGLRAPLNRRMMELVREAEARGQGSPALSPDALWQALSS